jgi:RNA polymerase sigma-70 factor, ECF subfamily
MEEPRQAGHGRRNDGESAAWLQALTGEDGPDHDRAVRDLHELLLRAARFEVARRRASLPHIRDGDLDDLALQSADDALVAVLRKLPGFRGESRFTTWAYKFAIYEASVKLRRRAWQARELPLDPEGWALRVAADPSVETQAEQAALLGAIGAAMDGALTPHQREVLVAVVLGGIPIDVLAERLESTRGAVYKTLHDARRKLRLRLAEQGFELEEMKHGA